MNQSYQVPDFYNKKSAVIHMEHKVSLVGLKLFNVLLSNAFNDLKTKREHQITLKDLFYAVPSAKNIKNLKKTLQSMSVSVAFNIFEKDHDVWGTFSLLPFALIDEKQGVCRYSFVEQVTELLINAVMYTKINLLIQKSYKGGKYGWSLYELCLDYKNLHQTPIFTLDGIRTYLGISETKYKRYKDFHHWVLKVAIKDINDKTDLIVELKVYKKLGKTVTHLQFLVQLKSDFILPIDRKNVASQRIIYNDMNCKAAMSLKNIGITSTAIYEIVGKYTYEEIKEQIQVFKENKNKRQGVQHPDHFLKEGLKKGWVSKNTEELRKKTKLIEADKKAVKAKDEEKENLYKSETTQEWFDYLLSIQQDYGQNQYKSFSTDAKTRFREHIFNMRKDYDDFESIPFITEIIEFFKAMK